MKKILPLLLMLSLLVSNCQKEEKALFELAYTEDFVIPAGLNPFDTHYFVLRDIPIGTYFTANNVDPSDLNSINPKSARLTNIFAGSGNYDFIQELSVRMYTDNENDWKEIFWRDAIPLNNGDELDIIPTLVDAKPYMQNTKFNIEIQMRLRAAPQSNLETRFRFAFDAK